MNICRLFALLSLSFLVSQAGFAQDHTHHAQHNMVLFGESEIFASHLVYKQPHNYQVILRLQLAQRERDKYLAATRDNPQAQFIFLLDTMDIKEIRSVSQISGPIFYLDASGGKHEVIPHVVLTKEQFRVVYFDELPLSLSKTESAHGITK